MCLNRALHVWVLEMERRAFCFFLLTLMSYIMVSEVLLQYFV